MYVHVNSHATYAYGGTVRSSPKIALLGSLAQIDTAANTAQAIPNGRNTDSYHAFSSRETLSERWTGKVRTTPRVA